jgi:type 1 glutamine amidotransferase
VNLRKNVALVRDLTDTMYNPRRRPFVDHFRGTDLVVEHVEKYWCPTVTSAAILGGEPFRFGADRRPHLVFVIGEDEYDTKTTLPEFARSELETLGMRCTFVHAAAGDPNDFPGLEALAAADLVAVSVRRRTPRRDQLELLRRHVDAHKPVVGIRTASHAFDRAVPDAEHASWPGFDAEVLGGSYQGHFGNKPPSGPATWVRALPDAATHPILAAWPAEEIAVTSHLYKNPRLGPKVTPLLAGRLDGKDVTEPVAWINTADDRRVFYTSLGNPGDFRLPAFRSLLRSGFLWCLGMTAKR